MDISVYISELLYQHDCVIVPGFGGFVGNYKPAVINQQQHTISPPSKAISFNRYLQNNDGLLANHIAGSIGVSFDKATQLVQAWVTSAKSLLNNGNELVLKKVGKLHTGGGGSLQFIPDESINYLRSSYGLKVITAEPIDRTDEIEQEPETDEASIAIPQRSNAWRIAAMIFLLACITGISGLMYNGVGIDQLKLNEASVLGFVNHLFKPQVTDIKPIPVEETTVVKTETNSQPVEIVKSEPAPVTTAVETPAGVKENTSPVPASNSSGHSYYIIVGAFTKPQNIEAMRQHLAQQFPNAEILTEKVGKLTRVGYSVGDDEGLAKQQLTAAQAENSSYWLFSK